MGKSFLYGWSCLLESVYKEFGLQVVESIERICFGPCRHMDVVGWPEDEAARLRVSQKLSGKQNTKLLESRIPIPPE